MEGVENDRCCDPYQEVGNKQSGPEELSFVFAQ
jgi:hypothetical protein